MSRMFLASWLYLTGEPCVRRIELGVRNRRVRRELLVVAENDLCKEHGCWRGAARDGRRGYRPEIPLPVKAKAFDAGQVLRCRRVDVEREPDGRAGVVERV